MKAVVLLSGGLDSTVAAYAAKQDGDELVAALWLEYGQKHARERRSAEAVAEMLHIPLVRGTLPRMSGSALTDADKPVPTDGATEGVAPTFVPGRNAVFFAVAAGFAAARGAKAIVTGVNAVDYSGYPDCRPGFVLAMQRAIRAALDDQDCSIRAPLLHLSKADIVRLGAGLGAPLSLTWSCYQGGERPCGVCDSCRIRADGFASAGVIDVSVQEHGGAET